MTSPDDEYGAPAADSDSRERVVNLLRLGRTRKQIQIALGLSSTTVCYHLTRAGLPYVKKAWWLQWRGGSATLADAVSPAA